MCDLITSAPVSDDLDANGNSIATRSWTPGTDSSDESIPPLESASSDTSSDDSSVSLRSSESQFLAVRNATAGLRQVSTGVSQKLRRWMLDQPKVAAEANEAGKDAKELGGSYKSYSSKTLPGNPPYTPDMGEGDCKHSFSHPRVLAQHHSSTPVCDPPCAICLYVRNDPSMKGVTEEVD